MPEDNLYKIILVRTYQLINQLIASGQWSYDLVMESSAQYFNRAIIWSQPAIPLVTKVGLKLTKSGLHWITISPLKDEALTQYKRAARLLECKSQGSSQYIDIPVRGCGSKSPWHAGTIQTPSDNFFCISRQWKTFWGSL